MEYNDLVRDMEQEKKQRRKEKRDPAQSVEGSFNTMLGTVRTYTQNLVEEGVPKKEIWFRLLRAYGEACETAETGEGLPEQVEEQICELEKIVEEEQPDLKELEHRIERVRRKVSTQS